jgi:hypothetical protein
MLHRLFAFPVAVFVAVIRDAGPGADARTGQHQGSRMFSHKLQQLIAVTVGGLMYGLIRSVYHELPYGVGGR